MAKTPGTFKDAIKRPGALTRLVGGAPSKNLAKVRKIAASGTPLEKKQANFFLNILRRGNTKRKRKSLL